MQTVFLLGGAVVQRPLDLPAEVKAVAVGGFAVVASYSTAWLLVSRVPGMRWIL